MIEDFNKLKIEISEKDFAIVRSKRFYTDAFANIKYNKEVTVIIEENRVKEDDIIEINKGWNLITFDTVLGMDLVGFIAKISEVLAKENISIFVLSSYFTDHVFVKKHDLNKAIEVLKKLGVIVKE